MKNYAQYYHQCRQAYDCAMDATSGSLGVYNLKIHDFRPYQHNPFFTFPVQYDQIIESLSHSVNAKVANKKEHFILESESCISSLAIKISEVYDLPQLEQLAAHFIPQLERTVFASYAMVSAIHIYRNLKSMTKPVSSWLWHYDNNPKEAIKLLIYLTDVSPKHAPFEFLRHRTTQEAIKIETSRTGYDHWEPPSYPKSRIPDEMIDDYVSQGYEKYQVLGPKGTAILFDNNCIHRANIPCEGYRDVVIFNLRPVHIPIRPSVNKEFTGSWMHKDPVIDPEQLAPILRSDSTSS